MAASLHVRWLVEFGDFDYTLHFTGRIIQYQIWAFNGDSKRLWDDDVLTESIKRLAPRDRAQKTEHLRRQSPASPIHGLWVVRSDQETLHKPDSNRERGWELKWRSNVNFESVLKSAWLFMGF